MAVSSSKGGRRQPLSAGEQRRSAVRVPRPLDGVRVLAVDDEPETWALLQAVLDGSGAQSKVVESVAHALNSLDPLPDVLIGDLAMRGRDGFALIREVRAWMLEERIVLHRPLPWQS